MKSPITQKQLQVPILLYKFRFLTTNHLQKLFYHKVPQTVQKWIKKLVKKGYIYSDYSRKEFGKNRKPAVCNLLPKSKEVLKDQKDYEEVIFDRLSRESHRSQAFIEDNLFIADFYLLIRDQTKTANETLHFSTKNNLLGYAHFPQPLPDAYIAIKNDQKTRRYFLFLLKKKLPRYALEPTIKTYIDYSESTKWQNHTNNTPLPYFLIICPYESVKKKVSTIISSEYPRASFYVTTRLTIQRQGLTEGTWERVK